MKKHKLAVFLVAVALTVSSAKEKEMAGSVGYSSVINKRGSLHSVHFAPLLNIYLTERYYLGPYIGYQSSFGDRHISIYSSMGIQNGIRLKMSESLYFAAGIGAAFVIARLPDGYYYEKGRVGFSIPATFGIKAKLNEKVYLNIMPTYEYVHVGGWPNYDDNYLYVGAGFSFLL